MNVADVDKGKNVQLCKLEPQISQDLLTFSLTFWPVESEEPALEELSASELFLLEAFFGGVTFLGEGLSVSFINFRITSLSSCKKCLLLLEYIQSIFS